MWVLGVDMLQFDGDLLSAFDIDAMEDFPEGATSKFSGKFESVPDFQFHFLFN